MARNCQKEVVQRLAQLFLVVFSIHNGCSFKTGTDLLRQMTAQRHCLSAITAVACTPAGQSIFTTKILYILM